MTAEPLPDWDRGRGGKPPTAVGTGEDGRDPVEAILRAIDALTIRDTVRLRERLRILLGETNDAAE